MPIPREAGMMLGKQTRRDISRCGKGGVQPGKRDRHDVRKTNGKGRGGKLRFQLDSGREHPP
eukprot:gene26342-biopygen15951